MVIINKHSHTKRHTAIRKSSFLSTLSLLLALLIMSSVLIVGIPTASAKGESPFVDCEEIYIDMRSFTGWTDSSASFRVFTFYNDSNDEHYCHEYAGNFDNDGWYEGQNVLQAGIQAVKFCDNVYSFRIPANNLSHLRIVRTNSNSTQKWNLSPHMWDNQRSKYTVGGKSYSKQNCIKIKGWDNNASWDTFTPTNNASYSEKTAVPDSSITGNSNLYTIDASFYDYYTDDEVQNGWKNIRYQSGHSYWEPYQYLNSKIASASSGVNYPMYFGNFYDKEDGFKGEGSSNMVNFSNWVNNSSRLGSANKSVVGLTGTTLDSNGDLVYAANGGSNSSIKVPFFDKSFLSSNKVGSVVNTKFPMRKVVSNGITTYAFNSEGSTAKSAGDSVWISSDNSKISYGTGASNGAKDALAYYSAPQESSGYGFFPFDYNRGSNTEAYNFGFGMRVDVKFNLGADDSSHIGQIKGTNGSYVDQVFNFTGDDDVWVYVDGKLILDLGGDHKKANGSINFHNRSVSVTTGTNTLNDATRNTSFTLDNYGDPTAEHTLTMFYVERGMVESNLSFNFNFAPIGNELIVDKTVNTTNINTGLKTAVAAADTFSFNQPTANGKVSSKGTISNSTYTLKNAESISFKDQFDVPTPMTVTESESSPLEYTTSWKAVDLVLKGKGVSESQYTIAQSSGNSKTANFTYQTLDTSSDFAMTRVQLSYINTPTAAPVTLTKTVTGLSAGETDTTDFNGTVEVSLDGGSTWGKYPLTYSFGGNNYTLTSAGKLASNAQLRNGRTLTFAGLPQGAKVRFTEDATDAEHSFVSVTGGLNGIDVGSSGSAITVTNQKLSPDAITKTITVKKTFDGQSYNGSLFKFRLEGLNIPNDPAANAKDTTGITPQQKITVSNGTVTFDALTFESEGVYRYFVYEDTSYLAERDSSLGTTYAHDISQTGYNFVATITVTKSGNTLTASNPVFTRTTKTSAADITTADLSGASLTTATFTNVAQKGSLTINKTNQSDEKVGSVKFALYKLTEIDAEDLETLSDAEKYDAILALGDSAKAKADQSTNSDGVAEFTDIDIYESGYTSSGQPKYQTYALVEIGGNADYHINKTPQIFTFPTYDRTAREYKYHYEFDYVNGMIRNPYTAGNGMNALKLSGIFLVGMSLLALAGFVLYKKRNNKSFLKAKHYK